MRHKALASVLFLAVACSAGYWAYVRNRPAAKIDPLDCPDHPAQLHPADVEFSSRVPVPNNRGPEVPDGFRGEVHPLLHRPAQTEVTAYWVPPKIDKFDPAMPPEVRRLFAVKEAVPT